MFKRNKESETVDQFNFIESTKTLLEKAKAPATPLEEAVESAREVNDSLAAIKAGSLVINPPLSHERHVAFQDEATTIIGIGEKALGSLAETAQTREKASAAAAETSAGFAGKGSEAKG